MGIMYVASRWHLKLVVAQKLCQSGNQGLFVNVKVDDGVI